MVFNSSNEVFWCGERNAKKPRPFCFTILENKNLDPLPKEILFLLQFYLNFFKMVHCKETVFFGIELKSSKRFNWAIKLLVINRLQNLANPNLTLPQLFAQWCIFKILFDLDCTSATGVNILSKFQHLSSNR